jgi:hypothetical protein
LSLDALALNVASRHLATIMKFARALSLLSIVQAGLFGALVSDKIAMADAAMNVNRLGTLREAESAGASQASATESKDGVDIETRSTLPSGNKPLKRGMKVRELGLGERVSINCKVVHLSSVLM